MNSKNACKNQEGAPGLVSAPRTHVRMYGRSGVCMQCTPGRTHPVQYGSWIVARSASRAAEGRPEVNACTTVPPTRAAHPLRRRPPLSVSLSPCMLWIWVSYI